MLLMPSYSTSLSKRGVEGVVVGDIGTQEPRQLARHRAGTSLTELYASGLRRLTELVT